MRILELSAYDVGVKRYSNINIYDVFAYRILYTKQLKHGLFRASLDDKITLSRCFICRFA